MAICHNYFWRVRRTDLETLAILLGSLPSRHWIELAHVTVPVDCQRDPG
jgi:hypothetical protein